ncbi:MAG: hypothetical protein IKA31_04950, partial [Clostridia bacterium]|nr:hypothetical protein [Clostridia bacterium]
ETVEDIVADRNVKLNWVGNLRYILLNSIEKDPSKNISDETVVFDNSATNYVVQTTYLYETVGTEENYASLYVYKYEKATNYGNFVTATEFVEGLQYFATDGQFPQYAIITTRYGETIDLASYVTATANGGTFTGWVSEDGNTNYTLRPLTVTCGDQEVIQLYASWNDIFLYFELNGGSYKQETIIDNGDGSTTSELNNVETIEKMEFASVDAGSYIFNLPKAISSKNVALGPQKTGYTFIGWSDTYENYDEYAAAGKTGVLYKNNSSNSVTYTISDGESKTLYAIWQPVVIAVTFSSAEEDSPVEYGTSFTINYNYGDIVNIPFANDERLADWYKDDCAFDGWIYNGVNLVGGSTIVLDINFGMLESDLTNKTLRINSVWKPTSVNIKIYLNGGSYIGNVTEYITSQGSDENGTFIYIENQPFNEKFDLIPYEDFYKKGSFTESYRNLKDGAEIKPADMKVELTPGRLDNYELRIEVIWEEGNCYIKGYYGGDYHKFFNNFEKAVLEAEDGKEVVLLTTSVSIASTIVADKNLFISIDESIKSEVTLRRAVGFTSEYMFEVKSGKKLTFVKNDTANLVIDGTFDTVTGAVISVVEGSLEINSGVIIKNNTNGLTNFGGAIYAYSANITINGAVITGNKVEGAEAKGGAIYATENSNVVMVSGDISNNTASSLYSDAYAGGIYTYAGTLTINGGSFVANKTQTIGTDKTTYGGVICAVAGTAVNIRAVAGGDANISFSENIAENGGAIYFDSATQIPSLIMDSVFEDNNASVTINERFNGGAIYVNNGILGLGNLFVVGNKSYNGGALYIKAGNTGITASYIYGNTAANNGGAFYVDTQALLGIISSVVGTDDESLTGNTARNNGGAIYSNGNVYLAKTTIVGNIVAADDSKGGAIYIEGIGVNSVGLNIYGCTIVYNSASLQGGAIYVGLKSVFTVAKYKGEINTALFPYLIGFTPDPIEANSEISYNSARQGGALYVESAEGGTSIKDAAFRLNIALKSEEEDFDDDYEEDYFCGGAIYLKQGALYLVENVFVYKNTSNYGGGIYVNEGASLKLGTVTTHVLYNAFNPTTQETDWSNTAVYGGFVYNAGYVEFI